jgi:hypothetical protein
MSYVFIDQFGDVEREKSRVGLNSPIPGKIRVENIKMVDKCQCCRGKWVFPLTRDVKTATSI